MDNPLIQKLHTVWYLTFTRSADGKQLDSYDRQLQRNVDAVLVRLPPSDYNALRWAHRRTLEDKPNLPPTRVLSYMESYLTTRCIERTSEALRPHVFEYVQNPVSPYTRGLLSELIDQHFKSNQP